MPKELNRLASAGRETVTARYGKAFADTAARGGWPPTWLELQQKEDDKATGRPLL
jgi:hypothetical protein